jgi:photosystem II stability/assembly factor-like uncharacterized protein
VTTAHHLAAWAVAPRAQPAARVADRVERIRPRTVPVPLRRAVLPPLLARLALALLVACLVAPCPSARAGWSAETTGAASSSLQAIACPSATACFAVQYGAGIVRRATGGVWSTTAATGSSASFYAIGCWDTTHCLVAGSAGTLLFTADGGGSWTAESGPDTTTTLYGVSCPSAGTCVAVGTGGAVWSSAAVADGATAAWTAQTAGSGTLSAVSCVSAGECWAGGAAIYTNRSGTWVSSLTPAQAVEGLSCPAAGTCVAAGANGLITRTANAGTSWTTQSSGTTAELTSVSCADATHCVAAGAAGTVVGTADGGTTWAREAAGLAAKVTGVACATAASCRLVTAWTSGVNSEGEARSTADGGGWGWTAASSGTTGNLRAVTCPDARTCQAVGDAGTVVTSTDGGLTWTRSTLSTVNLYSVACVSTSGCVSGGTNGTTYFYDGRNLATGSTGSTSTVTGLACPSDTVCFATDSGGRIYKSVTGGRTWGTAQLAAGVALQSVACGDTTHCTAVGASASSAWYTTDGATWTATGSAAGDQLRGVACPALSACLAVGLNGVAAGSDGGATFTARSTGIGSPTGLLGVACRTAAVCAAVGQSGTMLSTTDGGVSWSSLAPLTSSHLNGVTMPTTTTGVAVGDGGRLYRLVDLSGMTCSGGSLTTTPPATIAFPSVSLAGPLSATATAAIGVDDETSAHSGWAITATSTQFVNGSRRLPATATTITGVSMVAGAGSCAPARSGLSYPITLPAASTAPAAVRIATALSNTGVGPTTVTPTFALAVPANGYAGSYASTWTLSVTSGP